MTLCTFQVKSIEKKSFEVGYHGTCETSTHPPNGYRRDLTMPIRCHKNDDVIGLYGKPKEKGFQFPCICGKVPTRPT